ncbi:hypothetical protein HJB78_14770 [Rhizobium lentis]|nr:hypothetical protein [Rhizobium lentis]
MDRWHDREAEFMVATALSGKKNGRNHAAVATCAVRSAVTGKKSTHATDYTHRKSAITSPANTAALSLWREMDKFTPSPPYAIRRKKLLLNRHKTRPENNMINGRT